MSLTVWVFDKLDKETSWKEYLARTVAERAVNQKVGKASTSHPGEFNPKEMSIDDLRELLATLQKEEEEAKKAEKKTA